ncbi:DNA polymerase III subunit delta [Moraxella equi]|uniref:DNA polymerase III subunit delta n=2 Tax=Moraxella equi TaxID=60442 RepID=A0ABX3NJC5_9GAMM|nr:DNA polymerase III subunit delta [Moraxella equi]OPH39013.1 DNA polymerase III subunit delta [Moraxella equi]
MQQRFLPLFHHLKNDNTTPTQGLWVMHSDEPLLHQWLIDACRPQWSANNQLIKRIELSSAKSWLDVVAELNDLSLFGDSTALIVTGNHKPDTKAIARLTAFADDVAGGHSHNHLIWCLPKQDKKSLATKALKFFDNQGLIIDGNVYNESVRTDILTAKAQELGLILSPDAWQMLLSHTEHHLLSAYQTLWRTSFLYTHGQMIGVDELERSLVDGADFTVFHLSDVILAGDAQKSLAILHHLKRTDTAPSIVLWAIAKDVRLILQIQAGKAPSELGIWQSKAYIYEQTARRLHGQGGRWLSDVYAIDKAIKGVSGKDVWQLLTDLVLSVCGVGARQG